MGLEARFEETQEPQLSTGHFENTGSTLFFYAHDAECSYLVIIKPKHSRICICKTKLQYHTF